MTSYILRSVQSHPTAYSPSPSHLDLDPSCTFCRIISQKNHGFVCYEDEWCLAFLDIYPLRPGHTLLIPKAHHVRLADLPEELGGAMGRALTRLSGAICEATGNPDLNVVCNQGYAQAVHVHWHLIPAPILDHSPSSTKAKASSSRAKSKSKPKQESTSGQIIPPSGSASTPLPARPDLSALLPTSSTSASDAQEIFTSNVIQARTAALNASINDGPGRAGGHDGDGVAKSHMYMLRGEMAFREFLDEEEGERLSGVIRGIVEGRVRDNGAGVGNGEREGKGGSKL